MTVPVMINGQGPFQFVVDTGSERTAIAANGSTPDAMAGRASRLPSA